MSKYMVFFYNHLQKVPEGDWFCDKCKPVQKEKPKKARKKFVLNDDSEGESEEEVAEEEQESSDESFVLETTQ